MANDIWSVIRDTYPQMDGIIMVLVVIALSIVLIKIIGYKGIYVSALLYSILVVFFHTYGAISIEFAITGYALGALIVYIALKNDMEVI